MLFDVKRVKRFVNLSTIKNQGKYERWEARLRALRPMTFEVN